MMRNPELSLPLNHWIIFKNDELIIVLTIFLTSLCHQIPFLNIKKLISNLRTFKMLPVIFNHVYMYVCTHNTHVLLITLTSVKVQQYFLWIAPWL